jgi:predicted ATPase
MTESRNNKTIKREQDANEGITRISLSGYKSFFNKCSIDILPLTILAGTNSSGKSSIMQPLLLMKQTLEESYNPGTLLLNGANVKFTSTDQILSFKNNKAMQNYFDVGVEINDETSTFTFEKQKNKPGFQLSKMELKKEGYKEELFNPNMTSAELLESAPITTEEFKQSLSNLSESLSGSEISISKERFMLKLGLTYHGINVFSRNISYIDNYLYEMLHLPGLRGNPERNYPTTATESDVNSNLPGTFEKYVASIITQWQDSKNKNKLSKLENALQTLKLTNGIKTKQINDTEVGIFVARANNKSNEDFVSIADVGLGVSQTLPILVALIYAKPKQIVFIEQPEIHLHPRGQYALAILLVEAANRGVKVIVETHSSLLIRGIQTQIAKEAISHEIVALNWFSRDLDNGATTVVKAELDEYGTFGDWPEDFDDIALEADMEYLNAVEKRSYKE